MTKREVERSETGEFNTGEKVRWSANQMGVCSTKQEQNNRKIYLQF